MRARVQYNPDEFPLPCEVVPEPGKVGEVPLADGRAAFDFYPKDAAISGFHDKIDFPLSGVAVLRNEKRGDRPCGIC